MPATTQLRASYSRHGDKFWPLSKKSTPAWSLLLSAVTAIFARWIIWRKRQNFLSANAKRRERIIRAMDAMLQFIEDKDSGKTKMKVDEEEAAAGATELPDKEQAPLLQRQQSDGATFEEGLPELEKIHELLWDPVEDVNTERFGVDPQHKRTAGIQALLKRAVKNELRKVIYKTRKARGNVLEMAEDGGIDPDPTSLNEAKELAQYWTGDELDKKLRFATEQVYKKLGKHFVDKEILDSGKELLLSVRKQQQRNVGMLFRQLLPCVPTTLMSLGTACLAGSLRAVFYTLDGWSKPVEAALASKLSLARWLCFRIFIAHLIIDYLNVLSSSFQTRSLAIMNQTVKGSVMKAMMKQDYEFFDRHSPGELQDRLNKDCGDLGAVITLPLEIVSTIVEVFFNLANAYKCAPGNVFWPSVLPLLPVSACQQVVADWKANIDRIQGRVRERESGKTNEVLREIKTIRQFAMEDHANAEYARGMELEDDMNLMSSVRSSFSNLAFGMSIYGGLVFTVLVGAAQVMNGSMRQTDLFSVMFQLNFNVVFPTRDLLSKLPRVNGLRDPILRISELLDSKPKIEPAGEPPKLSVASGEEMIQLMDSFETVQDGDFNDCRVVVSRALGNCSVPQGAQLVSVTPSTGTSQLIFDKAEVSPGSLAYPVQLAFSAKVRPRRFHGKIELDNVHFSYPTNPQMPVLKGVSLKVEPGQKVALVGMTGCGKSSIMGLLLRLYQPSMGTIWIDGRRIEDYDVRYMRSRMVIVDQHTVLFRMTIRENVAYGMDDVGDEEMKKTCEEACAWDFIEEKPDKLMTDLTTGGSNLSGGQRQRLAIARAMVRKPDIILLDEATSALDGKNEAIVQEALNKLAKRGSALVIAHRLTTIQDSDRIVVVDKGVDAESGTHEELLIKGKRESGSTPCANGTLLRDPPRLERSKSDSPSAGGPSSEESKEPAAPKRARSSSPDDPAARKGGKSGVVEATSYLSLWEAGKKGDDENLTLRQLEEKIETMKDELGKLEARASTMKDHVTTTLPEAHDVCARIG